MQVACRQCADPKDRLALAAIGIARKGHGRLRCVQPRIVESVAAHSTTGQNGLLHPQRRETWLYRRVASDDASHPGARSATVVELFETIRSEEHTSELQSLMRISYAVF